jgi:autotransporter-associated beta strand protein
MVSRYLVAAITGVVLGALHSALGQIQTGIWANTAGGPWSSSANWSNSFVPNAVGHWAWLTGNNNLGAGIGPTTTFITNDIDVTLGFLLYGDTDRGSQLHIGHNGTTYTTITFDTGDGRRALLSHGSGDLHMPGVAGWHYNIGNAADTIYVGIRVQDPDGLYIENFYDLTLHSGITNSTLALDGMGHDVVKSELGNLIIQRVVTNVSTLYVRDGRVHINLEGNTGARQQYAVRPDITNIVVGVAPGVRDLGEWNPIQTQTNIGENTELSRSQVPYFQIAGDNNTNAAGVYIHPYNVTLNRGAFRTFSRTLDTISFRANWTNHQAWFTGTWTLNGSPYEVLIWNEVQDSGSLTSSVRQQVWSGTLTGPGGFTKLGSSEMTLLGTNDFQGPIFVIREFDRGRGRYGAIALREGGILTDAEGIKFLRAGSLYLDNSAVNINNRVPDDFWIVNRQWGRFEILGNATVPTTETIGSVTNLGGTLFLVFDLNDAGPQAMTLNMDRLVRAPGSIVQLHVKDVREGALSTNAGPAVTVNLADGGASLAQVGGDGSLGYNRKIVVGVFGGDASDIAYHMNPANDPVGFVPSRADQFVTVDGGRLRTLRDDEMVHLGGRATNFLTISQADAPTDANVNIAFRSTQVLINTSTNGFMGSLNMIKNRIVGDVTWNALRTGIATAYTGSAVGWGGNSILLDHGGRLTLESGMLLAGRDTRSGTGDDGAGTAVFFWRGAIDLDGTANNREGIIQVANGQDLYIGSVIEARNGLTKGGENSLVLLKANAISGTVNIVRGLLSARHPAALGGATQVVVSADGNLRLQFGGSFNPADLVVGAAPWGYTFLMSSSQHNQWNGRIILRNVDEVGVIHHDMQITAGENSPNATLTVTGDIAADATGANSDIVLFDPIRLTTGSSGGIINLKGRVGDRFENGVAMPLICTGATANVYGAGDITNRTSHENFALRFRIDGPALGSWGDELAVHIYRPWRAVGRIYAEQGTIRFLGDPVAGEGEFWWAQTLTNANFANANSGFQLGGPGTDVGGSATLLLTKNGQVFNAERWTVATDVTNNTLTIGLEHFGPSNATVTIGNTFDDGTPAGDDNRITFNRPFNVFAHNGYDSAAGTTSVGRVNIVQTLRGNAASRLVKVGSGQVWLQGPNNASYSEPNDIFGFVLLGGELVFDRSPGSSGSLAQRRSRDSGAQLVLAGGDLTLYGSANGSFATELLHSNLLVMAGDSIVRVRPAGPTQSNLLQVASFSGATVTRQEGGTVHFNYDLSAGGNAGIQFGPSANARVGSWAVFSSNDFQMLSWAATDANRYLIPFTGYSVDTYGSAGVHTEVRNGNPPLLPSDVTGSLRFDTNLFQNLDLDGSVLNIADRGILVTRGSSDGFGGPQGIANGTLTSSGDELIIHNYSPRGFHISAAISGNVALTHSGISTTWLSSANGFTGRVYLNGGVLPVSALSQLGTSTAGGTNTLGLRGGVLQVTSSLNFSTNVIELGGDGGTIWVAAGHAATFEGPINSETNIFSTTAVLQNNGHGDLIKTGPGALVIGGHSNVINAIQGLIDIRQGSLVVDRAAISNEVLFGSSHSYYDGIVVRSGASLVISNMQARVGGVLQAPTDIRDWLILEQGAKVEVWDRDTSSWQIWRWNAPIMFLGDATIFVDRDEMHLNQSAGYLEGPGSLVKEGNGRLSLMDYSPDFTGAIKVQDGTLDIFTRHVNLVPNASEFVLGYPANTNRGVVALYVRPEADAIANETVIGQNIRVVGESDDTRLGVFRGDHLDVIRFTGDIDLTGFDQYGNLRELRLHRADDNLSARRNWEGGDTFDVRTFVWLEGGIIGTNKRLRISTEQSYSPNGLPNTQNNPTNSNLIMIWTFAGANTNWTGTLEVGNRQGTDPVWTGPDYNKQPVVRFGKDDGQPTLAISSNVVVVLRHDARLQAFGSQVTIGTLFTDGKADNVTSDYFGSDLTTNSFIENAGTQPGSFRICQFTNATISATIRDGVVWSPVAADQPAASLSIYKDGPATLTLLASNSFSGMARVMAGTLALSGTGSIRNAHTIQIDAGATLDVTPRSDSTLWLASGQTLQGHGTLQGGLIAESGSFVKPGASPGALTVVGDVTFDSGSTFEVEILGPLSGQYDQLLMNSLYELTLNGATLSVLAPNPLSVGTVFPIISGWGSIDSSTFAGLPDGTTFTADANQFQIHYGTLPGYADDVTLTVVPEPGTLATMGLALAVGAVLRRRVRR